MRKLVTLVLALALWGASTAATAATMSCFVDTPALDPFTPKVCFGEVPGAKYTTAVFRVDPVWSKNWNFLFHLYLRQRHRLPFGLSSAPPSLILTVDT